jgi:hypothetical protein
VLFPGTVTQYEYAVSFKKTVVVWHALSSLVQQNVFFKKTKKLF